MPSKRDEAKQDLIEPAGELALHRRGSMSDPGLGISDQDYLELYYRRVAPEDLVGREPSDIADPAFAHRELARERPQGVARVAVLTPRVRRMGGPHTTRSSRSSPTTCRSSSDSVTNAIGQVVPGIYLVVHPQVDVRRSFTGELREILPAGHDAGEREATGEQLLRESWIQVEIDRVTPEQAAVLETTLRQVLGDVREAVEDWPKMRQTALRIADNLATDPPPGVSDEEVSEGWELLRWLADDHFTFLGFREYELRRIDGEDVLVAVPGSGLGILRADQQVSASFGTLPPEQRARAREAHILGADAGEHQVNGPPLLLPRLRRGQAVRRRGPGGRGAPLPRPVHVDGLHAERAAGACAAAQGA